MLIIILVILIILVLAGGFGYGGGAYRGPGIGLGGILLIILLILLLTGRVERSAEAGRAAPKFPGRRRFSRRTSAAWENRPLQASIPPAVLQGLFFLRQWPRSATADRAAPMHAGMPTPFR